MFNKAIGSLLLALPFVIFFALSEWRGKALGKVKAPWQGWVLVAFTFFCFLGTTYFWQKNKNATNEAIRKEEKGNR